MTEANASLADERTLEALLQSGQGSPLDLVERIMRALLAQVRDLHASGVVHRDIRPATVHLDAAEQPQLAPPPAPQPFGGEDTDAESCPPELQTVGQVDIPASIEAARQVLATAGLDLDPRRIDVYQLGALFCSLLTGQSVTQYLRSPRVKVLVPPHLQPLLELALGYCAAARFADCDEFLAGLDDPPGRDRLPTVTISDTPVSSRGDSTPSIFRMPASGAAGLPFERLGHFRILRRIGRGGMGDVYLAEDERLQREVAIKVLPAELARNDDLVYRFHNEAAVAAQIDHPNVVSMYFIGEDAGHHFFAMKYVAGESLQAVLDRRKRLSVAQALAVLDQCLLGLGAAHARGLVHRDVKPGNILLESESRRVLVADFGLVKTASREKLTASGVVVGTMDYIAPEQVRDGQNVDSRADLYALGVVAYQMLSGRLPFQADTAMGLMFKHAYEAPPPLGDVGPEIPAALAAIVERLMAKNPDERYPSCAEVRAALAELRQEQGLSVTGAPRGGSTQIVLAPRFEPLPLHLDEQQPTGPAVWWPRLRDRVRDWFWRSLPEPVQKLQGTTQQVDGALRDFERRQAELNRLVDDARQVVEELQQQARSYRAAAAEARRKEASTDEQTAQAARQEREECERIAAELEAQEKEQQEQLDEMCVQRDTVAATLQRIQNQRDALMARLVTAEAHKRVEGGIRRRGPLRPVAVIGAIGLLAGCMMIALWFGSRGDHPNSLGGGPRADGGTSSRAAETTTQSGAAVDLLKLIDVTRVPHMGRWTLEESGLRAADRSKNEIQFPCFVPEEYILKVRATREQGGSDYLGIGINVGGQQCTVNVDVRSQQIGVHSGLANIDGRFTDNNETTTPGYVLTNGKPAEIVITVRDNEVTVFVDDKRLWTLNRRTPHHLTHTGGIQDGEGLYLLTHEPFFFSKMELTPLKGKLTLRPPEDTGEIRRFEEHTANAWGVAWSPDGKRVASCSGDQTVRIRDTLTGGHLLTLANHHANIWRVAFSPDGKLVASASDDKTSRVWDAMTGQQLLVLEGHTDGLFGVAFNPDGQSLATASFDETVKIWDSKTGKEVRTLRGHKGGVVRVAYSPDGKLLASAGCDATVRLWETATGKEACIFKGHSDWVQGVAFSPDSRLLASCGRDSFVKVWDIATGTAILSMNHTAAVTGMAWSPNGRYLASSSSDRTVILWDATTGRKVRSFLHDDMVESVAFSPDSEMLASASRDQTVRLWRVPKLPVAGEKP